MTGSFRSARLTNTHRAPRPWWIVAPAVIAIALLALPIVALLWRTPWSSLVDLLSTNLAFDALRVSLVVSLVAAGLCLVLGLPLAWTLARLRGWTRRIVRSIVLLPMVLPPVVAGTALLFALGPRQSLIGPTLERIGIVVPFTTAGAVLAATVVALPFFVLAVEAAMEENADGLEAAAATLGASPGAIFRRITLPRARSSILAGVVLAWARALGEFGATLTFAGNVPGRTQTLPLATFLSLEAGDPDQALALSVVLLLVSLGVLIGLRDRWLLR